MRSQSKAATAEPVTVRIHDGIPIALDHEGVHYRVSDHPTELVESVEHPLMTHPDARVVGWRFQGTDDNGRSRVFDVRRQSNAWELLRVWD